MRIAGVGGHLTYCTNIHRGETWEDVWQVLRTDVLEVKRAVAPDEPFGIGLRLSAIAVDAARRPDVLAALKAFLRDNDLYVFTVNAFPYGPFHGVPVKEEVYLPDWHDEERLRYTNAAADLLAALLPPDHGVGSVSTVPGAFKANATSEASVVRIADLMVRHVAHLVETERRTGAVIALAIEPEPCCLLETTDEAIAFFRDHLFTPVAARRLSDLTDATMAESKVALRRHLGICLDLCHAAVEFEEAADVFAKLREADIAVTKLQISAGLRLPRPDAGTRALLRPFDDGVYLHQVVERRADGLHRYPDLAPAFAGSGCACGEALEWRVHYHVPLFLGDLGAFGTTQSFVREALALHRHTPLSDHLEVETYTWTVLPDQYRTTSVVPAIARELQWVRQQLTG